MTRTARSHPALALAIAATLALTGCAETDEPGSAPSAATTEAMTPEPDPTTATTATTPPAPAGANTITTPADGSTVAGPQIEVTGEGTAFEATLLWRVVQAGTDVVVTENFTTAGANGEIGPYAFTITLSPGSYTLEVWEPDMSDGGAEGDEPNRTGLASSTFTVS